MARSQTQTGAEAKPATPAGRHKPRSGGGKKPEPDANASPPAARCWQSGAKPQTAPTGPGTSMSTVAASPTPTAAAALSGRPQTGQRGWGELPAAERASRRMQLEEMGFSPSASQAALEECSWDVNRALDHLFNGSPILDKGKDTVDVITPSVQSKPQQTKKSTQKAAGDGNARPQPQARSNMLASHQSVFCSVEKETRSGAVLSAAGDSTTASGVSTPRLFATISPQQELSPASSGDDLAAQGNSAPQLPPGLEAMPTLLAAPPGLEDEPTPCPGTSKPGSNVQIEAPQVFQVPAVIVPTSVPQAGAVSVVPKRRLQKVQHTWECEEHCAGTQLSVEEETFVYVWSDSKTETGWIYAESLICCSRAGWLPESMLQPVPPGRRWMRVTKNCDATFPMQLQVEAGNMVLVDASLDPVNGWIYAEQVASATGRPSLQGLLGAGGWVPIQCVEWA